MFQNTPEYIKPVATWFHHGFVRRNHAALRSYPFRVKLFGPLPSFQDNIDQLDLNRRFLACCGLQSELLREIRYPYFDLDLLEFAYAIPREQLVGVGKRRFLMKRALAGIVPDEILNRKKKMSALQETPKDTSPKWPSVEEVDWQMVSSSAGIVDSGRFLEALQKARRNEDVPFDSLSCTLLFESWLRHLTTQKILSGEWRVARHNGQASGEHSTLAPSALHEHKSSAS